MEHENKGSESGHAGPIGDGRSDGEHLRAGHSHTWPIAVSVGYDTDSLTQSIIDAISHSKPQAIVIELPETKRLTESEFLAKLIAHYESNPIPIFCGDRVLSGRPRWCSFLTDDHSVRVPRRDGASDGPDEPVYELQFPIPY